MPELTPKLGIKKPLGNETVSRAAFNENWDIIDAGVVADLGGAPSIQAGLDASKPAPGTTGRLYVATDTQIIYRDTGSAWQKVGAVKWSDIDGKPSAFTPALHGNEAHDPDLALASDLAAHLAETVQAHGDHDSQDILLTRDANGKLTGIDVKKPDDLGVSRITATLSFDANGRLSSVLEKELDTDGATVISQATATIIRDAGGRITELEVR